MGKLLDNVNSPADIKGFSIEELKTLCAEIRQYMIECCATNPGHLGSSLGAVELIVGMHYVYDTPKDNIVFDVGHQAYAHKIMTGRREAFLRNRKSDGISGFPKRSESEYDVFGSGHSSTSISAALGLAKAAEFSGSGAKTIALIGDGALTGGLAYEGLNNAGASDSDILVIVNDNNISIDKNTGALHNHLLWLTTHPAYNKLKEDVWRGMGETSLRARIQRLVVSMKSHLVKQSGGDLFESLGFRYFGPIDGNDIEFVVRMLQRLRGIKGPKVLHVSTHKGKGYAPAEEDQTTWHAPGQFDPVTGKRLQKTGGKSRYQDVFGEVLLELARSDERVVGITPAMASGCGMNLLAEEMPHRFFDVGIAEEHAVTFSAGLAAGGMKPFCNIYSSFSQRAYDQIIHDVALQNLGVVICLDRSGLVGEDGATHHGMFDMAAYRSIPNAVVAVPRNEIELKNMMYTASKADFGPFIIRYPRGSGEGCDWRAAQFAEIPLGQSETLLEASDGVHDNISGSVFDVSDAVSSAGDASGVDSTSGQACSAANLAIIAAGPVANRAYEAALEYKEKTGSNPAVYNIRYIKPLDTALLDRVAEQFDTVITIEDGCTIGGLHGAVAEYLAAKDRKIRVLAAGAPDRFIEQGTQAELRHECGLDKDSILAMIASPVLREDLFCGICNPAAAAAESAARTVLRDL